MIPPMMIEVKALGKKISDASGHLEILHEIEFSVMAGETVAVVGASGSGKSTLLGIIAGLDIPTTGTVFLAGQDIFALDEDARAVFRAGHVGFVFQNFQLMSNLTALENVMLPLELSGQVQARRKAQEMLERVGLGQRMAHYPRVLSGGEQQRVALARAFVVEPQILLADEPTGSLDFVSGAAVMDLMLDLNQAQGTTLMMVTHDRELAARCKRQIRIEGGRLALSSSNKRHVASLSMVD